MMHHISQAVLASSITDMSSFSVLIWANFRGLMSIGLLATYGMAAVIVVSSFLRAFLPDILQGAHVGIRSRACPGSGARAPGRPEPPAAAGFLPGFPRAR